MECKEVITPDLLEQFAIKKKGVVPSEVLHTLAEYGYVGTEIGRGKFGVVYHFTPKASEEKQVVKIVTCDKDDLERVNSYFAEKEGASQIRHPHSISWEREGHCEVGCKFVGWLIYPYKPMDIDKLLNTLQKSTKDRRESYAEALLKQLVPVIRLAADRRLVHNDIKPDNILAELVRGRPRFYLTDFGNSRTRSELVHSRYGAPLRDILALVQCAVYIITGSWEDIYVHTVRGLPESLQQIIDILRGLPLGAQVPYDRILHLVKVPRSPSVPSLYTPEDHKRYLTVAIGQLNEKRDYFNKELRKAIFARFRDKVSGNVVPQLLPLETLLRQTGEPAVSLLTANVMMKAVLHCLDDDENGLVPWIAFSSPRMHVHYGASVSMEQLFNNAELFDDAAFFCK